MTRSADSANHAVLLVRRTAKAEGIAELTVKPVLHGDNGVTLKALTVLATLQRLGVAPSYSRPRTSDDSAYADSLFRNAKHRPAFPAKGCADLDVARAWADHFTAWYNTEHRHSGIRYVSPAQRHAAEDVAILAARHELFLKARKLNPARWSGSTQDWSHVGPVTLNPERESVVAAYAEASNKQPPAAGVRRQRPLKRAETSTLYARPISRRTQVNPDQ